MPEHVPARERFDDLRCGTSGAGLGSARISVPPSFTHRRSGAGQRADKPAVKEWQQRRVGQDFASHGAVEAHWKR